MSDAAAVAALERSNNAPSGQRKVEVVVVVGKAKKIASNGHSHDMLGEAAPAPTAPVATPSYP
jgi:hypothetical protein